MAVKKRVKPDMEKEADNLASVLADKTYGTERNNQQISNTSITLPVDMLYRLEDDAKDNKRKGRELKSVSAIIRFAVNNYYLANSK